MGREIERKFLVTGTAWKDGLHGRLFRQGYLSLEKSRTVRVRAAEDAAWLTIKGATAGCTRAEYEYPIPVAEAHELLDTLCIRPLVEKTRYEVRYGGHLWQVDEFHGANAGLVVAEIELGREDEAFERPPWLGAEVSSDPRYFNVNLVNHPFREWRERGHS
ncbi:MAG TPA: CYTH domain-containing protein [Gammaproteobacteria bacterium]|nr:CYTH domain-containing protein [Gammaproteobacteria bacterium]